MACRKNRPVWVMVEQPSRVWGQGRYRPIVVAGGTVGNRQSADQEARLATPHAPPLDDSISDVPAVDRHRGGADHLSRVLFDLSFDAEQGADPLYRSVEFHIF